jgi:hypothetical protein
MLRLLTLELATRGFAELESQVEGAHRARAAVQRLTDLPSAPRAAVLMGGEWLRGGTVCRAWA